MKEKTKFETVISWVFGLGIASIFVSGIAVVLVWVWKYIYELLMY